VGRAAEVTALTGTSAARDARVDDYLAPLPAWQRGIFIEVRDLLHEADPQMQETIKRSFQPYFVLEGNVAAFLAAKDWATIFLYDPLIDDPDGIITSGQGNSTGRQVSIRQGQRVPRAALLKMFRQIVAHNRAGGWRKLQGSDSARNR
jgi:hypothetical protein